jgi:hypothetical protein
MSFRFREESDGIAESGIVWSGCRVGVGLSEGGWVLYVCIIYLCGAKRGEERAGREIVEYEWQ